jgi:uncharacterized protein YndB with AHSA1/START domain
MASDGHAVLQDRDGRTVLRFERELSQARERVWRALTSHDELARWHPTPFELEPAQVGGRVCFKPPPHVPEIPDGRVFEYDPPRVLAYTWWQDELRWELREHDRGGCVLTLTHSFDDRFKAARDAAGWHLCLRALSRLLADAVGASQHAEQPRLPDGWSELNGEYQQRFGISPEQATPPPEL